MLRVRERIGPAAVETDSHGLSSELAVVAGSGKIDDELGAVSESALKCSLLDAEAGIGGHDACVPAAAGSGLGDVGFEPALHRCSMDPEAGLNDVTSCSSLQSRIGCLDSSISAHVSSHARSPVFLDRLMSCTSCCCCCCCLSRCLTCSVLCSGLLLLHAMMRLHCMIVPCVLVIQVVLVVSCLCRDPPATTWIIHGWAVIHAEKCDHAARWGAGLSCRP